MQEKKRRGYATKEAQAAADKRWIKKIELIRII